MSDDVDKLAALKAATQELREIRHRERALEDTESDAKALAMGAGVQKAIEAGDLQWPMIKIALKKHVEEKEQRRLLELDNEY